MNRSHWQDFEMPRFPRLSTGKVARSYDVVVIGGGITGITTAYLLKAAGAKVCLLERNRLASGDTGHTTAHLNAFVDLRVSDLVENFGETKAKLTLQAGQMAIDTIESLIHKEGLACDFRRVPGYLHAPLAGRTDPGQEESRLRNDAKLAQGLGFDCAYVTQVPGVGRPGVRFEKQALFHPLKFLAGLARAIPGDGSAIHEETEVTAVDDGPLRVVGEDFEIRCGQVVVATHVPLVGKTNLLSATLFQTKLALYSTYALGARIPRGVLPDASASDTSDPYYYWRVDPGERSDYLIFGGRDHKTGQARFPEHRFAQLEKALGRLVAEAKVDRRWSGQVVETHDGLPYIGEIRSGQFLATGFTGNGMTFGVVAGMMARDAFLEQANPWTRLFSPRRVELKGGALKDFFVENVDFPVYLLKQRLAPAEKRSPDSLRRGEGAVLKIAGERIACCRDEAGNLHQVSAVCTHMGCLVEWNGAERTWDCPCHGSRFAPAGNVIAGPAERSLKPFVEDAVAEPAPVRRHASVKASTRRRPK